jgi:endonuclease/exonuclease/phosphatase family metal-dependent hydrolase
MDGNQTAYQRQNEMVTDFIVNQDADLVCLQEYHGKGKTLYEPLQQTKTQLGAESYYYESYFNPRYQQLSGLVIFSKYKAVNKGKLKFDGSRTFGIYMDVQVNTDTVRIYNIHLASIQLRPSDIDFVINPGQKQDEMGLQASRIYTKLIAAYKLREKQVKYLVDELHNTRYPVILAGDFNDTPSSYVYSQVTEYLQDAFTEEGNGISITYAGRIPLLRIDYVMKSDLFRTLDYQRHKVAFSDHYPLTVGLGIPDLTGN